MKTFKITYTKGGTKTYTGTQKANTAKEAIWKFGQLVDSIVINAEQIA